MSVDFFKPERLLKFQYFRIVIIKRRLHSEAEKVIYFPHYSDPYKVKEFKSKNILTSINFDAILRNLNEIYLHDLDKGEKVRKRLMVKLNEIFDWLSKESDKYRPTGAFKDLSIMSTQLTDIELYFTDLHEKLLHFVPNNHNVFLPSQPIDKQKPEQETPKIFDELFYNTDLVKPCIDILKDLDPPLIDTDYNFIGRLKGVVCVWIDEMQRQGIVKSNYPKERKLFASLIPTKIKRFSIDESMFGKHQRKAEELYRTDIKTKLSKIKLSLDSH